MTTPLQKFYMTDDFWQTTDEMHMEVIRFLTPLKRKELQELLAKEHRTKKEYERAKYLLSFDDDQRDYDTYPSSLRSIYIPLEPKLEQKRDPVKFEKNLNDNGLSYEDVVSIRAYLIESSC